MKPRSDRSLSISAWAIRSALRLLGSTWRVRILGGEAAVQQLIDAGEPMLLAFWHNQSLCIGWFLYRYLHRRGFPITLFTSLSRDGEIVSRIGRAWGLEAVRGSASRGGSAALRKLFRALTRDRSSPIVVPDGPRGPIYKCKAGVVVLAQVSGAPIQAFGCAADRVWRLGSWDRLIVPRPFARLEIAIGEPLSLTGDLGAGDLGGARVQVEDLLDRVGREARQELAQGSQR